MLQPPEQRARERIGSMLAASGWTVQDKSSINLCATRGVAICELSFATCAKKLLVMLPPLAGQARIVAEVERRLSVVEELESVVLDNLQRVTHLSQSILQKAFTGNLL